MRFEFNTIDERNAFIERCYKEGLKYTYHDLTPNERKAGNKYAVLVVES